MRRPVARPRLDLTYRPRPGELTVPRPSERPCVDSRDHGDGTREPPLRDRLIPPRRRAPGIFRLTDKGKAFYDGKEIRWRSDGNWHYRGDGGTFDAVIHPDGSITFEDHPSIGAPESPVPRYQPPIADPSAPHLKPSGGVVGFTFRFEVTDAVMRRLEQDPYGAEKRRFARATRAWRATLRKEHRRRILRRALRRYDLTGPWCRRYQAANAAGRRRLRRTLFARWDETRASGSGQKVRAAIVRLARRCKMRYPVAELRRLNRSRRSKARFSP